MSENAGNKDARVSPSLCETHGVLVYEGECPDCRGSRERFHGLRWRWRYYIGWRLVGRKGPL